MELGLIIYRIMEGGGKVEVWKQNTKLLINTIEKIKSQVFSFHPSTFSIVILNIILLSWGKKGENRVC